MNITKNIRTLFLSQKFYYYVIGLFIIGILLMLIPGKERNNNVENSKKTDVLTVKQSIDDTPENEKLEQILTKVEGVGDIDIIINYSTSSKKIPLYENQKDIGEKIITYTDGSSTQPYITAEVKPEIEGVVVVAQGADNEEIISLLRTSISEYLGVGVHKISILKMK